MMRRVLEYWLPPLAWMGLIFFLSAQPDLPHAPGPWLDTLLKKTGHATAYGVLAWFYLRVLRQYFGAVQFSHKTLEPPSRGRPMQRHDVSGKGFRPQNAPGTGTESIGKLELHSPGQYFGDGRALTALRLVSIGLAVAYGLSDEYHQTFVPGRNGNLFDVTVDGVGACIAMLLDRWLVRRRSLPGSGPRPASAAR